METYLDFKVQEIKSRYNPQTEMWSKGYYNKQDDSELKSTRGHIFSLITFKGPENVDYEFLGKLIFNSTQEEYYTNTDGTPLQALEEATLNSKNKINTLMEENKFEVSETQVEYIVINIVVWGKILYVVNLGDNQAYIIRTGETENISKPSQQGISSVSGRIEEGDTFILGNKTFCDIFTKIKNLTELQKQIESAEKEGGIAALLVNLEIEQVPSENEKITFIAGENEDNNQYNLINKLKTLIPPVDKLKIMPMGTMAKRQKIGIAVIFLGLILSVYVYFNLQRQQDVDLTQREETILQLADEEIRSARNYIGLNDERARGILRDMRRQLEELDSERANVKLEEINTLLDEINKVEKVEDSLILYDFSQQDSDLVIGQVLVSNNVIYVLDSNNGNLYTYSEETGANRVALGISDIKYVTLCDNGLVVGSDTETINLDTDTRLGLEAPENITGVGCYLNNIYITTPTGIERYNYSADGFGRSSWLAEGTTLNQASGMEIDGNIYLIENNKNVAKLFTGSRTDFELSGLDQTPNNITDIKLRDNTLYILDSGGKSIIVTDTNGQYIRRYSIENYPRVFNLWVTDTEIYLANGTTLYKFEKE